jgi:phosphatidate phosphatase APP1
VVTTPAHRAARVEDRVEAAVERQLRRRGWRPRVIGYPGYGTDGWVRVLARVLLAPPMAAGAGVRGADPGRGWRRFLSATPVHATVAVTVGGVTHQVTTGRGGYVDAVLPAVVPPGWVDVTFVAEGSTLETTAGVRVVGADERVGVVSDIDDTVLVTALPRPLRAAWNTFVLHESSRTPVPAMAGLYTALVEAHSALPAPVVYLSTGAWNVAPVLERFLDRHGFPRGPLLMTDWGPTHEGWFRSGREHKRRELARLLDDLPQLDWLLVGDDGQHDPEIYGEVVAAAPDRVRAVLIRQLTAVEQVRTHGTPEPPKGRRARRRRTTARRAAAVPVLRALDGDGLLREAEAAGLL